MVDSQVNLISSYFDVAPSMSTHLPVTIWRKTVGTLLQLMQLLNEFPNISMDPDYDPEADDVPPLDPTNIDNTAPVKVWGNLLAFLERLDDELFKSMQCIDPHTADYVHRLKDEPLFLVLAHIVSDYFQRKGDTMTVCKVSA